MHFQDIIATLNAKMLQIGSSPEFKDRLLKLNVALVPQTLQEMAAHLAEDIKRATNLVQLTGIKAE